VTSKRSVWINEEFVADDEDSEEDRNEEFVGDVADSDRASSFADLADIRTAR
jgi:hypothetical protein|tara:strand:- start:654 stop:809 length:156 start_codon:yes stop_codon:yes gene_type:complete